jgi:branched-chain amino acid transport system substrate-binding protein
VAAELTNQKTQVNIQESVNNKATDFSAVVAKLKAAPPDVLVAVLRDPQLIPLGQQMAAAGLGEVRVIGTNSAKTTKMAKSAEGIKSLYLTSSALESREFSGGSEFLPKFRAAYKSEPVWAAHYAYDAIYVLAHTLRANGNADKEALRAKLRTIDAIAPVTGTMRFNASGEQMYGAITVYERRDGNWWPLVRSDQW